MFFGKSDGIKRGTEVYPYVIDAVMPQGSGGMAQVYIAHQKGKTEKVALKISKGSDSSYEEALRSEVIVLKKLNSPESHPNVIKILPIPIPSKYPYPMARAINLPYQPWYYSMEYLAGLPLSSYVRGSKGLPEIVALTVIRKIASALDHVHKTQIAHLDVKTENIVMRFPLKRGNPIEPVLIDFGVAAHIKEIQTDSGSLAFMPPERLEQVQARVAPEYSEIRVAPDKVDVYGLGVSFFEIMTGRLPFGGFTKKGLTSAILKHEMTRPKTLRSDITERTERLILAMLEKDPQRRPSFEEVISYIGLPEKSQRLEVDIPTLRH